MLYTEAYVLVLLKRFLPCRQNMISLVYTQIELLICISFENCSKLTPPTTGQLQHGLSAPTSVVCKSPILYLVYRGETASHMQEQVIDIAPANWAWSASKALAHHQQASLLSQTTRQKSKEWTRAGRKKPDIFQALFYVTISSLFPDISGTTGLIHHCSNPTRQFPLLCFYKEQQKKI